MHCHRRIGDGSGRNGLEPDWGGEGGIVCGPRGAFNIRICTGRTDLSEGNGSFGEKTGADFLIKCKFRNDSFFLPTSSGPLLQTH